ncbi:Reticulon-like protein [Entamoeba marina]
MDTPQITIEMTWWKKNKKSLAYLYNCYSGSNGSKAYYTAAGISVALFFILGFVLQLLNSVSVMMVHASILFILLHIDLILKDVKLPWKDKVKHVEYTRFKKAILEPTRSVRGWVYNMFGINQENAPKMTTIYITLGVGIVMVLILALVPVKLFSGILVVVALTVPQLLRTYVEKDVEKEEELRQFVKSKLKEHGLYVTGKEVRASLEANKTLDADLLEKKIKAKKSKQKLEDKKTDSDSIIQQVLKEEVLPATQTKETEEEEKQEEEQQQGDDEKVKND